MLHPFTVDRVPIRIDVPNANWNYGKFRFLFVIKPRQRRLVRMRLSKNMLLLKRTEAFQNILASRFVPLVILPASAPGEALEQSKVRANDLAVDGRIAGLGITVVESRAGELFVLASDNESQAVGFARKFLRESKIAEPWFLLLRSGQRLCLETADRVREDCPLAETGFVLPDGRTVEIVASFVPAQRNTAWLHSLGHNVGEHL
jgi:hypothetical protein